VSDAAYGTLGPMDLAIRRAVAADYDRVSTVFREASLSNEGDRPLLAAHPELLIFAPAALDEGRTLVAETGGRVVGFVTTVVDGDHCEIEDLFVAPAWMRRGVASRLMTAAVASVRGSATATVEVTANGHALAFYESAGFVVDREIDLEFGHGFRMRLADDGPGGADDDPGDPR
jgi:ribosomal protein S18 acetylase RimI-like enzyme